MDYPTLKRAVREQWESHRPTVILIEDKASGTQLIQELIDERVQAVTRFTPEGDKTMRMHAQTGAIDNGFVHLPKEAHWLPAYLHELTTFPKAKHDDQVDSTSQFLAWTKQRVPGFGLVEYYRGAAQAHLRGNMATLVKIRVPVGSSHVQTMSGRLILVPPDRIIEVTEEDARPLVAAGFERL